jgi:hypothetical protein
MKVFLVGGIGGMKVFLVGPAGLVGEPLGGEAAG